MADSPIVQATYLLEGQESAEVKINDFLNRLESIAILEVQDRDLTAPPGSPSNGQVWIPAATATGDWAGQENKLAIYYDGWLEDASSNFVSPHAGMVVFIKDEKAYYGYSSADSQWYPLQDLWKTTEYWTGEYRGTDKVYAKQWTSITLPDGSGGATSTDTALSLASGTMGDVLECHIVAENSTPERISVPYHDGTNSLWWKVDNTNVKIYADWDASGYTGIVTMKFTKA